MTDVKSRHPLATDPARLQRIQDLLGDYPDIGSEDRQAILHFLRKGPPLDVGLLTGIDRLRPQLQQFRQDHRRQLGVGTRDLLVFVAIILLVMLGGALIWDAGAGR